jgi:Xaa-Pro aminopeptidase
MKTDLDSLMQAHHLDALLITGPAQHNPPMMYLTGGGHMTAADLIKKRGEEPVLFYSPMERDEAANTGLKTKSLADYRFAELLKENDNNILKATISRYGKMLEDVGLTSGRVALFGKIDAGAAYALFTGLQALMPGLTFEGQLSDSILLSAMATKDEEEIERIRRMGKITTGVVGRVADFLTSQQVKDDILVGPDGQPVTVGDVKRRINLWLVEAGAENPEGTIFAIGRDAGVPHSSGTPGNVLRLGQTIVFDIFPCEAGGGYFYDFTRTWCLGYAPDEALALYADVRSVYDQMMSELEPGALCRDFQLRTCELFEAKGHPTIKGEPETNNGFVHSLGHGLGLNIHERPWFSYRGNNEDRLDPGTVVTIEPGLYYPDRCLGVRLEDTVWVRPDGKMEILAEYPLDFVLPVKS